MGMTSDQNENLSFEEAKAVAKREEEAAKNKKNLPEFIQLCEVTINGKLYQLLVGVDDHKWYKAEFEREFRRDENNRSPMVKIFSEEVTPVTEEEFYSYFPKSKNSKKK